MPAPDARHVLFGSFQFDIDTERTDFFDRNVEGLGHARLHAVIAIHDVFVHLGPAVHIVRLHSQHFLQRVSRAVGFQRPHFHLPETLTTELRLTTQRLLSNQAVGTRRTGVHLVIDQVVQFQHVHVTNGHRTLKQVTGTAVVQLHLAAFWQVCQFQHGLDFNFASTVEHWRCHRHAAAQVLRQIENFLVVQIIQTFLTTTDLVVDLMQEFAQFSNLALLFEHPVDLLAQTFSRKAQVGFKDLPNVHPRRYAQRVQNDVDRRAVSIMRHVFDRHNHRDHTLVTVTTSHLVAWLDATTDSQVNLDDLQYARRQVIALLDFAFFVFELLVEQLTAINDVGVGFFQLLIKSIFSHAQLEPLTTLKTVEERVVNYGALLQTSAAFGFLTHQGCTQTLKGCTFDDAELFVEVLTDLVELHLLDRQGTGITLNAVTGEDLYINNRRLGTGWHAQGGVFNVRSLLTEDGTQQLLFWSQLGLAFRGDLTDQNVAGANFSTHINNTGFVQFIQRSFTDVRDICSD